MPSKRFVDWCQWGCTSMTSKEIDHQELPLDIMFLELCSSCCRSKHVTLWMTIQLVVSSLNSMFWESIAVQGSLLLLCTLVLN